MRKLDGPIDVFNQLPIVIEGSLASESLVDSLTYAPDISMEMIRMLWVFSAESEEFRRYEARCGSYSS